MIEVFAVAICAFFVGVWVGHDSAIKKYRAEIDMAEGYMAAENAEIRRVKAIKDGDF